MARSLQLSMLSFGMSCSEELLVAVCDLLVAVAFEIGKKPSDKNSIERPRGDIEAMLGEYPLHRMEQACEDILLVRPSATRRSVLSSFDTVSSICFDMSKDLTCPCQVDCDLSRGGITLKIHTRSGVLAELFGRVLDLPWIAGCSHFLSTPGQIR